jgi:hypothetical protein
MNKKVLVPVFLVMSLLTLVYAIYRSTAVRVTVVEQGKQVVYGEPQHGLILGLCLFSGICILSTVALLFKKDDVIKVPEQPVLGRRTV